MQQIRLLLLLPLALGPHPQQTLLHWLLLLLLLLLLCCLHSAVPLQWPLPQV
jgi:hypothetical protein